MTKNEQLVKLASTLKGLVSESHPQAHLVEYFANEIVRLAKDTRSEEQFQADSQEELAKDVSAWGWLIS